MICENFLEGITLPEKRRDKVLSPHQINWRRVLPNSTNLPSSLRGGTLNYFTLREKLCIVTYRLSNALCQILDHQQAEWIQP
jgi:hypothetical protein